LENVVGKMKLPASPEAMGNLDATATSEEHVKHLPLRYLVCTALLVSLNAAAETPPPLTTQPAVDEGTELVVSFYKALLQDEPPTREQELALFQPNSGIRIKLAPVKRDPEDLQDYEPMTQTPEQRARRERQREEVAAAGPVALTYLRQHRDWFVPKNMKSIREIQISSTYHFVRNLEYMKSPPKPGYGNVLVLFVDDRKAPQGQQRLRTVIFPLSGGRIAPEAILLDGYQGKMVSELLDATPPVPPQAK
jgi:hypothetical protein